MREKIFRRKLIEKKYIEKRKPIRIIMLFTGDLNPTMILGLT